MPVIPLVMLSARAQRPIKPSNTVHVLSVLRLLLLSHAVDIIALHLRILSRLEPREAHCPSHFGHFGVRVHVHVVCGGLGFVAICRFRGAIGGGRER